MSVFTEEHLKEKLTKKLDATHVEVVDESDGCGGKFSCVIVSERFKEKSLLQRHRKPTPPNSGRRPKMLSSESLDRPQATPFRAFKGFTVKTSAPGKIILFGEHAVVYGKPALAVSLNLRTHVEFFEKEPGKNNTVDVNLQDLNVLHSYKLDDINRDLLKASPKLPLLSGLPSPEELTLIDKSKIFQRVETFVRTFGSNTPFNKNEFQSLVVFFFILTYVIQSGDDFDLSPFTVIVRSGLTIGAGLGSSASYSVALTTALLQYVQWKTRRSSNEEIPQNKFKDHSVKFSAVELSTINYVSYAAERIIHGTPSGIDNMICTYGKMIKFSKSSESLSFGSNSLSHPLTVLLIDSGVPKDTKAMVTKVSELRKRHPTVVDSIFDSISYISQEALRCFDDLNSADGRDLSNREEDVYNRLEELIDFNQHLLRALGVSHPALDDICSILAERGLHGKLTGAGGGGYVVALIPQQFPKEDLDSVCDRLIKQCYSPKVVTLSGPGVAASV